MSEEEHFARKIVYSALGVEWTREECQLYLVGEGWTFKEQPLPEGRWLIEIKRGKAEWKFDSPSQFEAWQKVIQHVATAGPA